MSPGQRLETSRTQKCSNKAKALYPGEFWGREFDEIDNI